MGGDTQPAIHVLESLNICSSRSSVRCGALEAARETRNLLTPTGGRARRSFSTLHQATHFIRFAGLGGPGGFVIRLESMESAHSHVVARNEMGGGNRELCELTPQPV